MREVGFDELSWDCVEFEAIKDESNLSGIVDQALRSHGMRVDSRLLALNDRERRL